MKDSFRGPLFVVGRPRSGTKLLRSILNQHPRIAIPISETNFIPGIIERFGRPSPLTDPALFDRFYHVFSNSTFFHFRAKHDVVLPKSTLRETADLSSWPSVFGAILRFYAPKPVDEATIWGDKSPSYLTHMPLLKDLFPAAKFVHIIRDPRDHVLSVRDAWGKHPLRSAERWRRDVGLARHHGSELGTDYLEIRFEDLVEAPEGSAAEACDFLGIDPAPQMTALETSHEDRGKAAGELAVVAAPVGRYRTEMTPRLLRRVNSLVEPVANELGYLLEDGAEFRPLSRLQLEAYRLYDGLRMTSFYMTERGWRHSLRHLWFRSRRAAGTTGSGLSDRPEGTRAMTR